LKVSSLAYFIPAGKRQAMPLDSHLAPGAACWGYPPSPHKRRILFCGCASDGRF